VEYTSVDFDPQDVRWVGVASRRLIVEVPPAALANRASDESPAMLKLDMTERFESRLDGNSLQVMRIDPVTGEPAEYDDWAYRRSKCDRPFRWYDDAIPWQFPEVLSGISRTKNKPRRRLTPGIGHAFATTGRGEGGRLAFMHTQQSEEPSYYAIYFDLLDPDAIYEPGPRAWLGDGQVRCGKMSTSTFATGHVRIDLDDFNGDGLLDIISGDQNGQLMWLPNVGSTEKPLFRNAKLLLDHEGLPIDVGIHAAPLIVDWDNDGANDLLVGTYVNRIAFFRNEGTNADRRLAFVDVIRITDEPLELPSRPILGRDEAIFKHDYYPVLDAVDADDDGDLDLLAGGYVTGRLFLYENSGRDSGGLPVLQSSGPLEADGKPINVAEWCAAPEVVDLDGDGLPELVSGALAMSPAGRESFRPLRYYRNVGRRGAWEFAEKPFPAANDLSAISLGTPRAGDLNGDGLLDLVVSGGQNIWLLTNIGAATDPKFERTDLPIQLAWGAEKLPGEYFLDYDRDGRVDVVSGYRVYLNRGGGNPYSFDKAKAILPSGVTIRHDSGVGDDWFWPRLADFDRDGDWDILFGDWFGHVWLHANDQGTYDENGVKLRDTKGMPIRVGPRAEGGAADFTTLQGARTVFTVGDFDSDGFKDLVLGDTFGAVYYAHNSGSGEQPTFDPLVKIGDLKLRLLVDATDWNNDGKLDVIAGAANGNVRVFLNAGPSGQARFADGFDPGLPPIKQPRAFVVDLNGDGDDDVFSPSIMGSVWVERSFINQGYAPARILHVERSGG
jgi:hypothetical protein